MDHILDLINKYTDFLGNHPEVFIAIKVFTLIMIPYYIILFKTKPQFLEGAAGTNKLLEVSEQYSYMGLWFIPPIVVYAAAFKYELPTAMWYFIAGYVGFVLGGRWLLLYLQSLKTGNTDALNKFQESEKTTVIKETKIESSPQ